MHCAAADLNNDNDNSADLNNDKLRCCAGCVLVMGVWDGSSWVV
jgi:hypothetical protein